MAVRRSAVRPAPVQLSSRYSATPAPLAHENVAERLALYAERHEAAEQVAVRGVLALVPRRAEKRHRVGRVGLLLPVGQEKEHPALRALVAAEEGEALVDRGGAEQVPRALRLGRT